LTIIAPDRLDVLSDRRTVELLTDLVYASIAKGELIRPPE